MILKKYRSGNVFSFPENHDFIYRESGGTYEKLPLNAVFLKNANKIKGPLKYYKVDENQIEKLNNYHKTIDVPEFLYPGNPKFKYQVDRSSGKILKAPINSKNPNSYYEVDSKQQAKMKAYLANNADKIKAENEKRFYSVEDPKYQDVINLTTFNRELTEPTIKSNTANLTTGRYNTGKVPTQTLDSIVAAADRHGIDRSIALAMAGRESTFGYGVQEETGERRGQNPVNVMSAWAPKIAAMDPVNTTFHSNKKLAQKYDNLLHKYNQKEGLFYDLTSDYDKLPLQERKELYKKFVDQTQYSKKFFDSTNSGSYEYIMRHLKNVGIQGWNPKDPNYGRAIQKDVELIKRDPVLNKYLKK